MGDEEVGEASLLLELLQKVDDLSLDGHVQSRHGLVADHQLGVDRQSAGDADSLALTARELVGVTLVVVVAEAALLHEIDDVILDLAGGDDLMNLYGLREDVTHGGAGGQGGVGILENDLHLGAQRAHLSLGVVGNILTVVDDLAAAGGVELEDGTAQSGLTAARLAHDTQGLTGVEVEGDVVHGDQLLLYLTRQGLLDGEGLAEILDFQERLALVGFDNGLCRHILGISHASPPLRTGDRTRSG